jgi:predicted transposase YbfD/YdcC
MSSPSTPCTAKKTFEAAAAAKAQLIVQLKDNQPTLADTIRAHCAKAEPVDIDATHGKGRNRDETRTVTVYNPPKTLEETEWKPYIAAVFRVERVIWHRDAKTGLLNKTSETAIYLANTKISAEQAGAAIRGHWGIENTSHYVRDVTMGEDASRIRTNPGIFVRLRSFAYNILEKNKTDTVRQDRYKAALGGIPYLLNMKLC